MSFKGSVCPAFSDIFQPFRDRAINQRFRGERDFALFYGCVKKVADIHGNLVAHALRYDHLIFIFYGNECHRVGKLNYRTNDTRNSFDVRPTFGKRFGTGIVWL